MIETSARLLRLLSLLESRPEWSSADLAERLGVTSRTVRRDVERLRAIGYPVHSRPGSAGGYRLGAGARLPPLLLDDGEAVAVAFGLRTAAASGIAGIEETSLQALAKLEQVLPSRLRHRVTAIQVSTVQVPRPGTGPTAEPDVLAVLAGACRDHERIRFDYHDHDGASTLRTVEPYRLVSWGRRWYLVAWDTSRRDWRTFRVDRITPRVPAGPRFTPRELPDGDIAAYVSRRVSATTWRYRARVTVHARAEKIADRIPPSAGAVEAIDEDTCALETGADTVETLAVYLGMLGADFTVTEPPELVTLLRELADRYHRAVSRAETSPTR